MKTKSFPSYLETYVKKLAEENTLGLFRLEKLCSENVRLLEVTGLYLLFSEEKQQTLLKHQRKLPRLMNTHTKFKKRYQGVNLNALDDDVKKLSPFDPLRKTYESYQASGNLAKKQRKALYHRQIMKLKTKHRISAYRIYNSLGLNHGNTHDFLKNKALNKLSLEKVKQIQAFLLEIDNRETAQIDSV